jgi:hypothetical protein
MGRICSITAAMLLLMTTWVVAGNFEVLSDASAVRTPTPLYVTPGMVVKAEFKSHQAAAPEIRTESDALLPERAPLPTVKPRPAAAFKQRRAAANTSPPPTRPLERARDANVAQAKDEGNDLELDLEKDLVISPPPPRTEEKGATVTGPAVKTRGTNVQEAIEAAKPKPKAKKKRRVKRVVPHRSGQFAASPRLIRKVHPLTSYNPWSVPAGTYHRQGCPVGRPALSGESYSRIAPPPTVRRYVRDGVTVKLAPRPVPASYPDSYYQSDGSDVVSSALDVIGIPFAFISSFF